MSANDFEEFEWAEFGLPATQTGDFIQSYGEVGLHNISRDLIDVSQLFHPASSHLGVGDTVGIQWPEWPTQSRIHFLFRYVQLAKKWEYVLGCIRGLREQPERASSRYYSYGFWLVLPDWLGPAMVGRSQSQTLGVWLRTAVRGLYERDPLIKPQGRTDRLRLPRCSALPPPSTALRELARKAHEGFVQGISTDARELCRGRSDRCAGQAGDWAVSRSAL
jgi:hypothetical protein